MARDVEVLAGPLAILREGPRRFESLAEDRYRLLLPALGVTFEIDRLRRERNELIGELCVRCDLPGARTVSGTLTIADLNLSSARARSDRAKLCGQLARTNDLDWTALLEEFSQRVLEAERSGQPAIDLREMPRPGPDAMLNVAGLLLPRRHPTVIFGDGGAAKSYTALYLAGCLVEQGLSVALFDWELAGEDHRDRLERLFADGMPRIVYARCERPLVHEVDRLRRIVREHGISYAVYDSVAFACDGPPEAAEVAGCYFRAVRQIGVGSLHIAHVSKADNADQKPFGSTFWHNGARCTWFAKLAEASPDTDTVTLGLFNRKCNMGALRRRPVGFEVAFAEERTTFKRTDVRDVPEMAEQMTVRQRMAALLRQGAMEPAALADEIGAKQDTITRTARRYKGQFVVLQGGRIALAAREVE